MAAKKANPGFEFIIASLKKNKKATYKEIAAAAAKKKLKVFPIMFGRAQTVLGIVKQAKRGEGKAARKKAAAKRAANTGRSRSAVSVDGSLESIIAAVKSGEQEKARYREALERIQGILQDALA